jgi:hypothetical protein
MKKEKKMKHCYKCGKIKPLKEFCKDRSTKDGLSNLCKSCKRAYNRQPKRKAYMRTYLQVYNQRPEVRAKLLKRVKLRLYWRRLWVKTILTGGTMLCDSCRKPEIGQLLSCHHKNGGGARHRNSHGGDNRIKYWREILESGCDPKLYQALCNKCHRN